MPFNSSPILYVSFLCALALGVFVLMVAWVRHMKAREEPLTSEESGALRRQGNVLGCAIFIIWGVLAILWSIGQIFHLKQEQLMGIFWPILFIVAIGGGIYLGASAIKDRISVLTDKGSPPMKGQTAAAWGVGLLAIIAIVLYVAWLKIMGQ